MAEYKYLDFGGLSYYDRKIKEYVDGKIVKNNEDNNENINKGVQAYNAWVKFLEGSAADVNNPIPNLKTIKEGLDKLATLEGAIGELPTKNYVDNGDAAARAYTDALANGQVKLNTEAIAAINDTITTLATKEELSAAEATAKAYTDELANGQVKTNTEAIAAINSAIAGGTHFIGVLGSLDGVTAKTGDVFVASENFTEELWPDFQFEADHEYIYDGTKWYELGNTTAEAQAIAANAQAIADLEANKADKADTLAGYGITDAYTKTEVDNGFVKVTDTISTEEIDSLFNTTSEDPQA